MLFCSACGDLTEYGRCSNPSCKSFKKQKEASPTDVPINPVRRKIPEEVGSYKNKGILGYYGYTITDPQVVRRRVLLRLYHDKLITNTHKKNHDYITLLGPRESDIRCERIRNILLGLNVTKQVDPKIRESDATYLLQYHKKGIKIPFEFRR